MTQRAARSWPRASGVLMHVTSLPGSFGCGDCGEAALAFIDQLAEARQTWWQTLPVGPPGKGFSPYSARSSFAGGLHLLSLERLVKEGWLRPEDAPAGARRSDIDVSEVRQRIGAVHAAAEHFLRSAPAQDRASFDAFREEHASWLDDWAMFAAISKAEGTGDWTQWPRDVRLREPAAMQGAARELHEFIARQQVGQYFFQKQWSELVARAKAAGVRLMGDVPFYPSLPSADVWANQELFELDENGRPHAVAGVPPDYFSATGQIWESPLYAWEAHHADGFAWWTRRMARAAAMFDAVRIDHFLGLHRGWRVPVGAETAEHGAWVLAPGRELLGAIVHAMPQLKIVAEDLGVVTSEAAALRDHFNLPGMRIIQFAFDEPDSIHLPANYDENCIAYSGTHDNNTTRGWVESEAREEQSEPLMRACELLDASAEELPLRLIDAVMRSPAHTAIIPMQDALLLGEEARMNTPGVAEGNWRWRLAGGDMNAAWERLQIWASTSGRVSGSR